MSLVSIKSIKKPRLAVTPPKWLKLSVAAALILVFLALFFVRINGTAVNAVLIVLYGALLMALIRKLRKRNYLVKMQVNRDGIYFQTDKIHHYFFVPWRSIGKIEKAAFPLNSRAIRFEITSEYASSVRSSDLLVNVLAEGDKVFVYTSPQLNNRDKLIDKMLDFKRPIFT